jgi:uncharacterized protein (TIGR02246 family)
MLNGAALALRTKPGVGTGRLDVSPKGQTGTSRSHDRIPMCHRRLKERSMRKTLVAAALFASLCSTAMAGPKEAALQVVEQWAKAFTASDVDAIVELYAPDALFLGTGSKTLVVAPEGIRKYFEQALLSNRPRGARLDSSSVMEVSDTVVVVTGLDTVTGVRHGNPISANGRVTFVIGKRGSGWQIVHFHRSAMPN